MNTYLINMEPAKWSLAIKWLLVESLELLNKFRSTTLTEYNASVS